ncbi:fatty acyl-AMP ligase [Rhodoligotrophos defluvii]|uniref:fatty acyl-AMP ligase n=1 Tax=Rhodoligotrophos defluvii TaxID=2561934 RepID=UPI001EEF9FDD|nr:fatty acyl-AMP ligase [Rhodoligotrophos defluvii]
MADAVGVVEGRDLLKPTPRSNHDLPQRCGDFSTLAEGLDYAARGVTGFNFYSPRGRLEHVVPYALLRERALRTARRLGSLGLKRGDRVAVVAETGPEFMELFFGCQYAGLIPCPMPYTMYIGGRDAYVGRVAGMLRAASAAVAVGPAELCDFLKEAAAKSGTALVLSHGELASLPASDAELRPFTADEDAYIQYSSGSTSDPKGVLISQAAICANARTTLLNGMKIRPNDRAFSWLPLYHDMGLVGFCLTPLMGQVTVDYLATPSFARRPALWLQLMSENRCTIAFSPSFGFDLAARRINGQAAELDLSSWRIAGIGGDMVRPDVLAFFAAKLSVAGFDPRAFMPCYGMAETTLAIAISDVDEPILVDTIDVHQYEHARKAVPVAGASAGMHGPRRSFVACGRPLPGFNVELRDDEGRVLGAREIGHVWVRGECMMSGYFRNPGATAAVMDSAGWLATGDMGYWLDGQIVITGRSKDLILHNGRNIWPQDIEWAVEQLDGLRGDDAAAFAVESETGEDEIVVLVQCRLHGAEEREELRRRAEAVVRQTAGTECTVVLVPPRSLPFTSSGKLSRAGAKRKYLAGELFDVARAASPVSEGRVHAVAAE